MQKKIPFHSIMRLFDILPNFPFAKIQPMRDYSYEHGIYELSNELPNKLRLSILRN